MARNPGATFAFGVSMDPIEMTMNQQFEIAKLSREIDAITDLETAKEAAKELLVAWKRQESATRWAIKEASKGGGVMPSLPEEA